MSIKPRGYRTKAPTTFFSHANTHLGQLYRQADWHQRVERLIRRQLGEPLHTHCWVGGYHQGVLTLLTDSAVWLSRLRYQQRAILQLLRNYKSFAALQKIVFKVRPVTKRKATPAKPRQLSPQGAACLTASADDTDDPQLKQALEKLAQRAAPQEQQESREQQASSPPSDIR